MGACAVEGVRGENLLVLSRPGTTSGAANMKEATVRRCSLASSLLPAAQGTSLSLSGGVGGSVQSHLSSHTGLG